MSTAPAPSFESTALPWLDDVRRFARSLARDEADADDVVQDTFLRAHRSWHTFVPGTDCRRWLFTICRNAWLRQRERVRDTVTLEELGGDASAALATHEQPEPAWRAELSWAITRALARVPEPFRAVVALVDLEDQPYEAAAAALGIPIGTVRSRLSRGRRIMQGQLLAHAVDARIVARAS